VHSKHIWLSHLSNSASNEEIPRLDPLPLQKGEAKQ
jgi:hypothetical protein